MPEVSVLITAYNREKYVAQSIASVLSQTFKDFEAIVVDDCSQDRTAEVAKSYKFDPRVRVIVNERNLGDYPNRNHAATFATGRFLKYHDSDDIMYPHCLATMVSALKTEQRAAFALTAGRFWAGGPCPILSTPAMSYQREFLGFGMFFLGPSCALFRTEVFRNLGHFPEAGLHSDLFFWLKACARANALLVPGDLFWYRVHPRQELQKTGALYEGAAAAREVWCALTSPACPLSGNELEQAKKNWVYNVGKVILSDIMSGRLRLATFRLRHCGVPFRAWPKYLRRAVRSNLAGTPMDEDGDYVVPSPLIRSAP